MIPIDQFIPTAQQKLKQMAVGQQLSIATFKRDRQIIIEKQEDCYHVYQDGYEKATFLCVPPDKLKKLLKTLAKKEFPRSNQLRIHMIQ